MGRRKTEGRRGCMWAISRTTTDLDSSPNPAAAQPQAAVWAGTCLSLRFSRDKEASESTVTLQSVIPSHAPSTTAQRFEGGQNTSFWPDFRHFQQLSKVILIPNLKSILVKARLPSWSKFHNTTSRKRNRQRLSKIKTKISVLTCQKTGIKLVKGPLRSNTRWQQTRSDKWSALMWKERNLNIKLTSKQIANTVYKQSLGCSSGTRPQFITLSSLSSRMNLLYSPHSRNILPICTLYEVGNLKIKPTVFCLNVFLHSWVAVWYNGTWRWANLVSSSKFLPSLWTS